MHCRFDPELEHWLPVLIAGLPTKKSACVMVGPPLDASAPKPGLATRPDVVDSVVKSSRASRGLSS